MSPKKPAVDPIVEKLKAEVDRQGLNNHQLGALMEVHGPSLERIWDGRSQPGTRVIRKILTALRRPRKDGGNPKFVLRDP